MPGNGGAGGSGGTAGLNGLSGGDGSYDAMDNSSPGGAGGGGSGGGVVGGAVGGDGSVGQSPAGNPGAGGTGGAGAQNGFAGSGNSGGTGGAGGAGVIDNQSNGAALVDSISVIAGSGGNGGQSGAFGNAVGGAGGAGGAASLTLTAPTATSTGVVLVQSGSNGAMGTGGGSANGQGGAGGAASFTANTLIAPTINLVKKEGALTATIGGLNMSSGSTALTLDGTTAAGVNIGNLTFANGHALNVTQANGGSMTATGDLNVIGAGNAYNSPIAYNAAGKALSFDFTGVTAANSSSDVMLATPGSAGVTLSGATTLTVTNTAGLAPLNLGGKYTLIGNTTGAFASQNLADVTSGAETHGLVANAGTSLYIFKNYLHVAGNYNWAAPYAVTAGTGSNEGVTLAVDLTLTAGGPLAFTSAGANSALLSAGILIAPSLSLSGTNAVATIGTLNVTGNDTALNLTGTTAANVNITTANLSGGRLLSINNSAGAMTLSTLSIASGQSGRLFVASGNNQAIGALNVAGADLTFVLPAGVVADQTIVSVTTANITGTTIGVNDGSGRVNLLPGQSVKLIAASGGITGSAANLTVQTANGDIFDLQVSGNDLLLILQQVSPTSPGYERLKAFAEGRTATLAFVNQGQDLILNQGFGSALAATAGPGYQFAGFGGLSGGWSRYNTGSHADVNGASLLAGLAVGNNLGIGRLTTGVFFEGGWGNYNSHNSFSNAASVKGDGDTSYMGGGILGRYDVTTGALSGLYFDASGRMGRAEMDFNTDDIKYNGRDADFDSSSMYYGAHAGLGYQWSFSEKAMLDLSGKFLWTRQQGDDVTVHGDKVRFKDADSLRTRLGGRFNYAVNDYITPYAGAYWEHEFDGKQRSSVNGIGIDAPELKGDTGVGELGLTIKPVADSGFSFDLGVQGYTGVREGVTGSVQLKFEF